MKARQRAKVYHVRVKDGRDIQKRIERVSEVTGRKIFSIMREAIDFGLPHVEKEAGIADAPQR